MQSYNQNLANKIEKNNLKYSSKEAAKMAAKYCINLNNLNTSQYIVLLNGVILYYYEDMWRTNDENVQYVSPEEFHPYVCCKNGYKTSRRRICF